jgi:hypothetical protein
MRPYPRAGHGGRAAPVWQGTPVRRGRLHTPQVPGDTRHRVLATGVPRAHTALLGRSSPAQHQETVLKVRL